MSLLPARPDRILNASPKDLTHVLLQLVSYYTDSSSVAAALDTAKQAEAAELLSAKVHDQRSVIRYLLLRLLRDRDAAAKFEPKDLQIDVLMRLVFAKEDTILVAPTGFGKSLVFQAWSLLSGKLSIIVVPLLGLADQIAADINAIPGAKPIVVTSETKGLYRNIYDTIQHGSYTHIIMSPEQLLAPDFRALLRVSEFSLRIGALVIDEAHCVAMWSSFRSEYAKIHSVRPLIPANAVLFACTATMDASIETRIIEDCAFGWHKEWDASVGVIRASVDRPDISIIFSSLSKEQPLHGLLFTLRNAVVFARQMERDKRAIAPDQILLLPLTVIFANTRSDVRVICKWLRAVLSCHGYSRRTVGAGVKTYTSRTAKKDRLSRVKSMKDANNGLRILVATSAFGMGLDVPDIELGVQYKAMFPDEFTPDAMNMIIVDLMQRIGRVARGSGRTGRFVVLTEHNAVQKEKTRQTRWMQKQKRVQPSSVPTHVPRSKRGSGVVSTRRNSPGIDPSGVRNTVNNESVTVAALDTDALDSEGVAAALPSFSPEDDRVTRADNRKPSSTSFSWAAAATASCKRKYILALLGNDRCRAELQTDPVSSAECCNDCNPGMFELWECNVPYTAPKKKTPTAGLSFVTLQYARRWAESVLTDNRLTQAHAEHDLFDIPTTTFIPDLFLVRLSYSSLLLPGNRIALVDSGSDNYKDVLRDLIVHCPDLGPQIRLERDFRRYIQNHQFNIASEVGINKSLPQSQPSANLSSMQTESQPSNSTLDRRSRSNLAVIAGNNDSASQSQSQTQSVSIETQLMCIDKLRSEAERFQTTSVYGSSSASGLRYGFALTRRKESTFYRASPSEDFDQDSQLPPPSRQPPRADVRTQHHHRQNTQDQQVESSTEQDEQVESSTEQDHQYQTNPEQDQQDQRGTLQYLPKLYGADQDQ